jgi:hypothetical protein
MQGDTRPAYDGSPQGPVSNYRASYVTDELFKVFNLAAGGYKMCCCLDGLYACTCMVESKSSITESLNNVLFHIRIFNFVVAARKFSQVD